MLKLSEPFPDLLSSKVGGHFLAVALPISNDLLGLNYFYTVVVIVFKSTNPGAVG